jgi:hypothetical protein
LRAGDGTGGVSGHVCIGEKVPWMTRNDGKTWIPRNRQERITELEHRIETLEAKIKAMETQETAKGLLTDTGAIG